MKKKNILMTSLMILLVLLVIIMIYLFTDYFRLKEEKVNITSEINNYNKLINSQDLQKNEIEKELSIKKEEYKNEIEEYNIWLETKEKIQKALYS